MVNSRYLLRAIVLVFYICFSWINPLYISAFGRYIRSENTLLVCMLYIWLYSVSSCLTLLGIAMWFIMNVYIIKCILNFEVIYLVLPKTFISILSFSFCVIFLCPSFTRDLCRLSLDLLSQQLFICQFSYSFFSTLH